MMKNIRCWHVYNKHYCSKIEESSKFTTSLLKEVSLVHFDGNHPEIDCLIESLDQGASELLGYKQIGLPWD